MTQALEQRLEKKSKLDAKLAAEIAGHPGLRLVGVMGWEAHATAIADPAVKEKTVATAIGLLTASADQCRALEGGSVDLQ